MNENPRSKPRDHAEIDGALRRVLRRMNAQGRKRRLLAVDGNQDYLRMMSRFAVELECETRTLDDASGLLGHLGAFNPDVLVIDTVSCPRHNGEIAVWLSGCPCPKDVVLLNGSWPDLARLAGKVTDPEGLHVFHAWPKPLDLVLFRDLLSG